MADIRPAVLSDEVPVRTDPHHYQMNGGDGWYHVSFDFRLPDVPRVEGPLDGLAIANVVASEIRRQQANIKTVDVANLHVEAKVPYFTGE